MKAKEALKECVLKNVNIDKNREETHLSLNDLIDILNLFCVHLDIDFIERQKELEPEFNEIVNKEFFNLI